MVAGRAADNNTEHDPDNDGRRSMKKKSKTKKSESSKNPKKFQRMAILAVASVAVAGAAWLAVQPAVGEGLTIHVMRAPP